MSNSSSGRGSSPLGFLFEYSVFLVLGALGALVWANVDYKNGHDSYQRFIHWEPLSELEHLWSSPAAAAQQSPASHATDDEATEAASQSPDQPATTASEGEGHEAHGEHRHALDLHFLINDLLMALFFGIAAKEVIESLLPGGALSNPRKAATPVIATIGGVVGPATMYMGGVMLLELHDELGSGWAVPCATDIAFSYLVARLIFGPGHPAIAFLLLLAIADDAAGLVILAVFYPTGTLSLKWLLLTLAAMVLAKSLERLRVHSFWWYLLGPGALSWFSFFKAGIHPALGLVPVIVVMPHAHSDLGIFVRSELKRHDTLNAFEHFWKNPVEVILGLFGLVNAGVVLSNIGAGTWLVLAGLVIGKPLGITLFTWLGEKLFRLQIPGGMTYRHVLSLGMIAGIGFTVALFVSTAAFPKPGPIQDSIKMGALGSFFSGAVAIIGARLLGIRPLGSRSPSKAAGH